MSPEPVQTKKQIEALLAAGGLRPQKRLGQHFLIDGNLMRLLAAKAELDPSDVVLEVGAGTGGLTDLLATRAARVVCVEIDRGLLEILSDRFSGVPTVVLIRGDVLESKHRIMVEVISAIRDHPGGSGAKVKLVANLPYKVATPLVMNLLTDHPWVGRLCFTVQAEVGERLTAKPGGKAYGPLSIIAQTLCRIETIARIPPQAFWPSPKVDSVMIRLDVTDSPFTDLDDLQRFTSLVRGTFDHRRKTLRSALGYVLNESARARICERFDTTRRPEQLTGPEWVELHRAVK